MKPAREPARAGRAGASVRAGVWLRRPRRTKVSGSCVFVISLWFALLPLLTPHFFGRGRDAHHSVGTLIGIEAVLLCLAIAGLVLSRRLWRAGIRLDADGIVIRNPLRTVRVPLAEAEVFVAGIAGGACPILKRRDKRRVEVWGLGREALLSGFKRRIKDLEPLCDDLNKVMNSLRDAAPRGLDQ